MEDFIIFVKPHKKIDVRTILDMIGLEIFDSSNHLELELSSKGLSDVLIVPMHEFTDMWNDHEDNRAVIGMNSLFIGHAGIEPPKTKVVIILPMGCEGDVETFSIYDESGKGIEHDFESEEKAKVFAHNQNWECVGSFNIKK